MENNCIIWGFRVVIPEALRATLEQLHASHMSMVKMKMLARSYFWWLNLDRSIENLCKSYKICFEEQKNPVIAPLTP